MAFGTEFSSFGKNIHFRPFAESAPNTAKALSDFIIHANKNDRRVRALGSGWSFSDVAICYDNLLQPTPTTRVFAFSQGAKVWGHGDPPTKKNPKPVPHAPDSPVLPAALLPTVRRGGRRLAHVRAGMNVRDLCKALDAPEDDVPANTRGRWAMVTLGGSAGQRVGGVISTSTHGNDFELQPIHDAVRAIDLIAPDGTRHWIERSSPNSITNPKKLAKAFAGDPLPPSPHYDDQWFQSVLVSMGSMGVIFSVVIECASQFGLSQRTGLSSWLVIRPLLASRQLFTTVPPWPGVTTGAHPPSALAQRALEIMINPYRLSDDYQNDPMPDRRCFVTSRADGGAQVDALETPTISISFPVQLVAFETLKQGGPRDTRGMIDLIMGALRADTVGQFPVAWPVMVGLDDSQQPVLSLEIAIPTDRNRHLLLIDDMLDRFDKLILAGGNNGHKLCGAFSLRFTRPSPAFLAIQNFTGKVSNDPDLMICHIEVPVLANVDALQNRVYALDARGLPNGNDLDSHGDEFLTVFEELADKHGAHLHWGQLSLTNRHNPQGYSQFSNWKGIRDQLTNGGKVRSFDNDFTVRYDISTRAPLWEVLAKALLPGEPTVSGPDAKATRLFPPTVVRNKDGALEVVVIGSDGQVCWDLQLAKNGAFIPWSWVKIPTADKRCFVGRVAIASNRDDQHPEAFARDSTSQKIFHAWRSSTDDPYWGVPIFGGLYGGAQAGWHEMDGDHKFSSSPDAAMAADHNLLVIALRSDGRVLYRDQKVELGVVGWNSWKELPKAPSNVAFTGDPCLGQDADRRLEVFVRDTNGLMWRSQQKTAKSDADWADWQQLGKSPVGGDPAAGRNADGRLEVFARGTGNGLFHIWQTSPGIWSSTIDWQLVAAFDTPLDKNGRPSVILAHTNLQVAVLTAIGVVVHFDQNGGSWVIHDLGGIFTSYPAISENDDGRLEVFGKFANDLVQHRWQDAQLNWI